MKTPKFWEKRNFISYILLPISYLYKFVVLVRQITISAKKIDKPIICIGNLTAGGAGKTPIAIEIGSILKELGIDFAYLSKGYGGDIKDFTLVENKVHKAFQVGDEPLLLAQNAITFIARNRLFGASQIAKMPKKKLIVMDDGLQNLHLIKDLSILVIDGNYGFGNGFVIPAGPLRENIDDGIKKADLIIIIGEDKFNIAPICSEKKIIFAKIKPVNETDFEGKRIVAFCGIARPDKFFNSLKDINCNLIKTVSYSDHYLYKNDDLKKMISLANDNKALLVTTKKDWIRIEPEYQKYVKYLDIKIDFNDKDYLKTCLKSLIR